MTRPSFLNIKVSLLFVSFVLLLSIAVFFGWQWYGLKARLQANGNEASKIEIEQTVKAVGALIQLPADEVPTMATVSDVGKLSSQPFFSKAVNGDKVLFYTQAKKAYLYRPSEHKLIEVAPLLVGDQAQPTPQSQKSASASAQQKPIRVALYNGSTTVGLTNTAAKKLLSALPSAEIIAKENAAETDYPGTLVVNLTDVPKETLNQITKLFTATLDQLPAGESKPEADILIILANTK